MKKALRYTAGIALVAILVVYSIELFYPVDLDTQSQSRVVVAEDGSVLRAFPDEDSVWRYPVALDDVSDNYVEALLGYEDQYFYQHPGVNPFALMRAAWQWVSQGHIVSGGSTLTMQVARIRYPDLAQRSIYTKVRQIVRALQIEAHFSKRDILTYYINHAPFGGTLEGVQAASINYFGYGADRLTDAQAALLAVLPQAPSYYRPDRHPERAQQARNKLMKRLVMHNVWTEQQYQDATLEAIHALPLSHTMNAPLLARRLVNDDPHANVIETFINPSWQYALQEQLKRHVFNIGDHVSGAVMVVENATGKVKAYVGSADFSASERFGYVDMNQAIRSPGSTLKPFIYGMAIDQGLLHSESLLMDVPLRFGDYQPDNFSGGFRGPVSVQDALSDSLNIPAVQVMERLGAARFYLTFKAAGLPLYLPKGSTPNLSIALGGVGMRLDDLVSAYSALGNGGQRQQLRYRPSDAAGRKTLLSNGAAWIVRSMLVNDDGIAIKTGTSYGYRDAWAVGLTEHYTVGVWVGRPDNMPVTGHYGRVTAVPLLRQVTRLLGDQGYRVVSPPPSVTKQSICWPQGYAAQNCDEIREAWVLQQTTPKTWYSTKYDAQPFVQSELALHVSEDKGLRVPITCNIQSKPLKIALWPAPLEPWLPPAWRRDARVPKLDSRCTTDTEPPLQAGLTLRGLDPEQRFTQSDKLILDIRVLGGEGPFNWYLDGILQPESGRTWRFHPKLGRQQLVVMDRKGQVQSRQFEVRATP